MVSISSSPSRERIKDRVCPVKNVLRIFSYPYDGSLVANDIKSEGNPIIFLKNAMETP